MSRLAAGGSRRGRWWDAPRADPPLGVDYRSSKRAIGLGMRAGRFAIQQAKKLRIGNCDAIREKALEFTQTYLDAEPELHELRQTPVERRPPIYQGRKVVRTAADGSRVRVADADAEKRWQDILSDLSESGAYKVIEQEWLNMGCRPGRQMVMLPPSWGRLRRRSRKMR